MNVTETKSEGLSREFRVSIPKGELAAKLNDKIKEIAPKVQLKGFRPGKVPAAHQEDVRQVDHGRHRQRSRQRNLDQGA
jgi:FKBP-type peptidyl-prolyl cis-trans isomerase (trigger factor)